METNLYSITLPPMMKALGALSKILDKAAAHAATKATERRPAAVHEEALLGDRVIFDQFDLKRQIQAVCGEAKGGAARLSETELPSHPDTETTIPELKARIEKTLDFLKSITPEQVVGKEDGKISLPYWPGKYLTGFEYATEYLLPNFYFHLSTAYAVIRKNGVDIGKTDYIGGLPLKDL